MCAFHYLEWNNGEKDISDNIYDFLFNKERITKKFIT